MGNKKKKYNARFPPARIKKIMQTDEEVGKIAAAVPVVISRALELFLETLITESVAKATEKNAKTLASSHILTVFTNPVRIGTLAKPKSLESGQKLITFSETSAVRIGLKTASVATPQVASVPDIGSETEDLKLGKSETITPHIPPAKSQPAIKEEENGEEHSISSPTPKARRPKQQMSHEPSPSSDAGSTEADKPKKKRGRPPKIKIIQDEKAIAPAITSSQTPAKTDTPSQSSHKVEATPTPAYNYPMEPMHSSIFSTENTVLSQPSAFKSRLAHTGNSYPAYTLNPPVVNTQKTVPMYANLSPTSQPIDLSTKSHEAIGAGKHTSPMNCLSDFSKIKRTENSSLQNVINKPSLYKNDKDDDDYDT